MAGAHFEMWIWFPGYLQVSMRSFPFKYPLKNIFVYRIDFSDYQIL